MLPPGLGPLLLCYRASRRLQACKAITNETGRQTNKANILKVTHLEIKVQKNVCPFRIRVIITLGSSCCPYRATMNRQPPRGPSIPTPAVTRPRHQAMESKSECHTVSSTKADEDHSLSSCPQPPRTGQDLKSVHWEVGVGCWSAIPTIMVPILGSSLGRKAH